MTQRDKWKKRPAVMRYRQFCDEVREKGVSVVSGDYVQFMVPMPASWPKWKKAEYWGEPHQSKPDIDNFIKAVLDALYEDDSHIYEISVGKYWDYKGQIFIAKPV
jgi:Holliday junction resolvase RusA-like endonuclease